MGFHLQRTAAGLLMVVGLGSLFSGIYRLKRVPQKPASAARRARRAAMREALESFVPGPELIADNRREAELWDRAVADGLADA